MTVPNSLTAESGRVSRKYPRAPITEAIIELRVLPAVNVSAHSCKDVFEEYRSELPEKREVLEVHAQISGGAEVGAHASQKLAGYSWGSMTTGEIVSVFSDRFSFSKMPPYDRWETFSPRAKQLWEVYRAKLEPRRIVRVATRFVNRIEIPAPIEDLSHYFRTAPQISPDMSQELSAYFMQLQLPQESPGCSVTVTQALIGAPVDGVASFILDIDVHDSDHQIDDDSVAWARLDSFRWVKNRIFEACITDSVRDLIS